MLDAQIGALVIIIIAVCEAVKRAGLKSRYIPVVAIILGVAGAFFFGGVSWLLLLAGVISGLTSAGLYDFGKKTLLGK